MRVNNVITYNIVKQIEYFKYFKETPLRDEDEDYMATPYVGLGSSSSSSDKKGKSAVKGLKAMSEEQRQRSAINITTEDLIPRLTVQNVADLVLLSMVSPNNIYCGKRRRELFLVWEENIVHLLQHPKYRVESKDFVSLFGTKISKARDLNVCNTLR